MKVKYILSIGVAVLLLLASCGVSQRHHVKIGDVQPVSVARFDSLIYRYIQEPDSVQRDKMKEGTGYFWGIYNYRLLQLPDFPDFYDGLRAFMADSVVSKIYEDTQREYADMGAIEEQLALMSARFSKLYPHKKPFVFQGHISALKRPVLTLDSLISVSLDCYLGADYPLYATRYHAYELKMHDRDCLLADVGEVMLRNTVETRQGTLLETMVYEGIIAHLLAGILDDASLATVLHYAPEEEAWCMDNEAKIWRTIVEQGDLFSYDRIIINKYINPAPFTSTLTQDSPGRVGRWVGWRIVQQYMQRQGLTVEDLAVDNTAYIDVLRLSNYNAR